MRATVIGATLLVGAGLATIGSLTLAAGSHRGGSSAAAPVAALPTPSTVGPLTSTTATTTSTTDADRPSDPDRGPPARPTRSIETTAAATTASMTTLPRSPLSVQVGDPVSVEPVPPVELVPPVRLSVDMLDVDVPVRAVGLEPDGQLEIPDETEVGWYRLGAAPGEPGAVVVAGHVSWNDTDGPFRDLSTLDPGAEVGVELADGRVRTYQVTERAQYPKLELPVERIWATAGPETLVMITCGGAFNPEIRRYFDNVVVYAVPVA